MLSRAEKNIFIVLFAIVAFTGVMYLFLRDFAEKSDDPFSVVSSPWQTIHLKAHVLFAPIFVFITGWLIARHAWTKYKQRRKKGRKSGLLNVIFLAIVIMSGYLLPVLTHEKIISWISWIHIIMGLLGFVLVFVHQKLTVKK